MALNEEDGWVDAEDDDWQDAEDNSTDEFAKFTAPVLPVAEKYVGPVREAGKAVLGAVGKAGEFMDRYAGSPMRAGIGNALDYDPAKAMQSPKTSNVGMEFAKGYAGQFGQPSEKAPSGKDLAAKVGIPTTEYSTGLVLDPYNAKTLKMSPAGVAGAALETVADPLAMFSLEGKTASKLAKSAYDFGEKAATEGTAKLGRLAFGIPEEQSKLFMQSPWEAKKSYKDWTDKVPMDRMEGQIVGDVGKIRSGVEEATEKKARLEAYLKDLYKQRQMDIKQKTVPLDVVRGVQGQMENEKAILGSMSKQADDILEKSGVSFQRDHLIRLIDQIGQGEGKYIVGDAASDAMAKLYKTKERLQSLPQTLDGPLLRDVMRQIRDDIDFGMQSGEFNSRLNRMRKEFTGRVSDVLKEQVPEYANIMQEMQRRSSSLEKMSGSFGNEARGIGTLSTVQKGGAKSPILDETLREFSGVTGNEDLPRLLDEYQSDLALQGRMQRGDISRELYPKEAGDIDEASKALEAQRAKFEGVRPLTESRTQAVINQQQGPSGGRLYDRRALDSLQQETGVPYSDIIQKGGAYRAFDKDATRGARGAAMGAGAGSALGTMLLGPGAGTAVGAGLGLVGGGIADRAGSRMLRSGISGTIGVKRTFEKAMGYLANNPAFKSKYGQVLIQGIDRGGYPAAALYHNLLMNNDPEYRKFFEESEQ